jgi:hypothetical protein
MFPDNFIRDFKNFKEEADFDKLYKILTQELTDSQSEVYHTINQLIPFDNQEIINEIKNDIKIIVFDKKEKLRKKLVNRLETLHYTTDNKNNILKDLQPEPSQPQQNKKPSQPQQNKKPSQLQQNKEPSQPWWRKIWRRY